MPHREVGDDLARSTERLLGELIAEIRALKHSENNTSGKLDAIGRQTSAIPQLISQVQDIKEEQARQSIRLEVLEADKNRREGAVGLVTWISRNWPVAMILTLLAAIVAWANGKTP